MTIFDNNGGSPSPWSSRQSVRLLMIAEVQSTGRRVVEGQPISRILNFDRLATFVEHNASFFPHCLYKAEAESVDWKRAKDRVASEKATDSIWCMPGSNTEFHVQLVDVGPGCTVTDLVAALEDMYYGDAVLEVDGARVEAKRQRAGRTHQLVIFSDPQGKDLTDDEVQRLVYRADLPARMEFSSIARPDELNRRPGRGAALGPFVSVLWGQQDYIENCAFLSVLMAASASAVIVQARLALLHEIASMGSLFGADSPPTVPRMQIATARAQIEAINRVVAATENRIALCIDGFSTLLPYIPALRVESYHRALFDALDAEPNRLALERLLCRLNELVRVEQDALKARVAQEAEERSRRWSLSVGIASAIALPFGMIFGFFGVSAVEVDPDQSMFSMRYWPIFLVVVGLSAAIVLLHLFLYWRHMRAMRDSADHSME